MRNRTTTDARRIAAAVLADIVRNVRRFDESGRAINPKARALLHDCADRAMRARSLIEGAR